MTRGDLVAIVESVYEIEGRDEPTWLRGIAERTAAMVGSAAAGSYGLCYDASDVNAFEASSLVTVGIEDPRLLRMLEVDCRRLYSENPDLVDAVFRKISYAPSSKLPFYAEKLAPLHVTLRECGVHEILGLNGVNVDGRSAHIGVLLNRPAATLRADVLARVASHLAAAFRLRQRIGEVSHVEHAEAVIEPSGKLTHAVHDARLRSARAALSDAALRLDRLRAVGRRRDPERALRAWRALVDARWSLVDHFERDGRRYVLAQRNEPDVGPIELLSERERQVVALAAVGHPNKMIGYELGIAVSTVGVLLTRACRKLGARSRRELVAAYERHTKRPVASEP
jgi:DNA-binding CsgD family transcriptional regulator